MQPLVILGNFASSIAPSIVADHGGTLIYSGGDDVLALLPMATAVRCARELEKTFAARMAMVGLIRWQTSSDNG